MSRIGFKLTKRSGVEEMGEGKMMEAGDAAPTFCLLDQDGKEVCSEELSGRWVVLYFYPKDNTSGCTQEAKDFTGSLKDFMDLGAEVLGVSPDSAASHRKFREKHDLEVALLSDPEHRVLEAYGAWGTKKMYGKEYQGVLRSTVIIDPQGKIARIWKKVRVKGHVETVLETLRSLVSEGMG
ncbi:MAG TPA: thioredoxin-dependent thiol peroxidase [Methanothrix sp.]|nr:thioredoxin-dependent thiol peroxidase [Methanothrix sp.]